MELTFYLIFISIINKFNKYTIKLYIIIIIKEVTEFENLLISHIISFLIQY